MEKRTDRHRSTAKWPHAKRVVFVAALTLAPLAGAHADEAGTLPPIAVYGPVVCLSCIDWADHLRQNGFTVTFKGTAEMVAVKRRLRVPADVESLPTAVVDGYFVEGYVPAEDIKLLLKERPRARGLAVPGLPRGAPGREGFGAFCETGCTILEPGAADNVVRRELFNTLLVGTNGKTSVWARH